MTIGAIRRNAPCPCGSGKRFKHCHGRELVLRLSLKRLPKSVRFVCFETHLKISALPQTAEPLSLFDTKERHCDTCRHVLNGFIIDNLVITDTRFGQKVAGVRGMYYPRNLNGDVEDSDLDDICVIAFHKHDGDFFGCAYDLDRLPAATSEPANRLIVTGFLKQKSSINPPHIFAGLCFLQFTDAGVAAFDYALRRGLATYSNPDFANISGMSGAPVYNLNNRAMCGMVARGGLQSDGACTIYFIDIFDIMQFLDAVSAGSDKVSYIKDRSIL